MLSFWKTFQNNLNYASTSNIREVIKFYNLDDKTFETDFCVKWEYNVCHWLKATIKWRLESLVFNNPFEIVRTRWNSSVHQSSQDHNWKTSKAVPARFKIHRTKYTHSLLPERTLPVYFRIIVLKACFKRQLCLQMNSEHYCSWLSAFWLWI